MCEFFSEKIFNIINKLLDFYRNHYSFFFLYSKINDNSPKRIIQHNLTVQEKLDSSLQEVDCSLNRSKNDKSIEQDEKDPFKMEVYVKRTVTPDCIYVAQKEYERSNMEYITSMQKFYNAYYSKPRDNWSEGALCTVYSAKDKSYFRAKILKIKSPMEVLVYLYDMGIEETVTMKDIQILAQQFVAQPTYCFKVKLAGILPCGGSSMWPSFSCITLSDIIQENAYCTFYITKLVSSLSFKIIFTYISLCVNII